MKNIIIFLIALILSGSFGCSDSDNGGKGADFDASLYYTKTEIDSLISDVVREGTGTAVNIFDVGYANGAPIAVPEGATLALIEICIDPSVTDLRSLDIKVGIDTDNPASAFLGVINTTNEDIRLIKCIKIPSGYNTIYAYQDQSDYPIAEAAFDELSPVKITPLIWFK